MTITACGMTLLCEIFSPQPSNSIAIHRGLWYENREALKTL